MKIAWITLLIPFAFACQSRGSLPLDEAVYSIAPTMEVHRPLTSGSVIGKAVAQNGVGAVVLEADQPIVATQAEAVTLLYSDTESLMADFGLYLKWMENRKHSRHDGMVRLHGISFEEVGNAMPDLFSGGLPENMDDFDAGVEFQVYRRQMRVKSISFRAEDMDAWGLFLKDTAPQVESVSSDEDPMDGTYWETVHFAEGASLTVSAEPATVTVTRHQGTARRGRTLTFSPFTVSIKENHGPEREQAEFVLGVTDERGSSDDPTEEGFDTLLGDFGMPVEIAREDGTISYVLVEKVAPDIYRMRLDQFVASWND